jgi:polyhydroxybutyrate depolymerase
MTSHRANLLTAMLASLAFVQCAGSDSAGGEGDARIVSSSLGAKPSKACGHGAVEPGDRVLRVPAGGEERTLRVHVPRSYDGSRPLPVVLAFHAYLSDATQMELYTGLDGVAEEKGFLAVYPQALLGSWNAGACCGEAARRGIDDVAFVRAALDALGGEVCTDERRIYATGMSNGGFFAHRVGCELADRIAAVAPVAGVNGSESCTPQRPIPVLHIHGTLDTVVPYGGNPLLGFPSATKSAAEWALRNGCSGAPSVSQVTVDTQCQTWSKCAGEATTTLCSVRGGGHAWPGGIPLPGVYTSPFFRASARVWEFFESRSLAP